MFRKKLIKSSPLRHHKHSRAWVVSSCTLDSALNSSDLAILQLKFLCQYEAPKFQTCCKISFIQSFINEFLLFSDGVMVLLRELGRGYLALCSYNCREAINILTSLPPQHYNTGWVLTHIGRAYFELAEYTQVLHNWLSVRVHAEFCFWTDVLCVYRQSVSLVRFAGSSHTELKEWKFIQPLCGTCRRMLPCLLYPKTWPIWTKTVLR